MTRLWVAVWPNGKYVRFRAITLEQFDRYWKQIEEEPLKWPAYLDLYRELLVDGPTPDTAAAGIVQFVGEFCLEQSGFVPKRENFNQSLYYARAAVNASPVKSVLPVLAATLHCSFSEMEKWDEATLFERIAQAEVILGKSLEVPDPALEKQKAQRQNPNPVEGTFVFTSKKK